MSTDATCPDPDRVAQLLVGNLPESEIDAIGEHVSVCPACTTILRNLSSDQTVLDSARPSFSAWASDPDDRAAIEQLIARWRDVPSHVELGDSAAWQKASTQDVDTSATGVNRDLEAGELAKQLLRPPKSPEELGWLGSYRVLGVLGSGGMGVVFEAEDLRLGRRVAIKAIQPGYLGHEEHTLRFLREARAAASIDHDNIVPIHQVGEDHGVPFLVMPLLKGESLESRLRRAPRLSIAETVSIGRQIATGIAAAHDRGLIHRDIKPANIWLEDRGHESPRIRILDFGLARNEDDESQLTRTGSIAGTPAFMSPEQARGELADPRSDLFSLGCVLYCMLAGKPPFAGRNSAATMFAIINQQPEPVSDIEPHVPIRLSSLVMQLLEKDPATRCANAGEIAGALQKIQDDCSRRDSNGDRDSIPQNSHTARLWTRLFGRNQRFGSVTTVLLAGTVALYAASWTIKVRTPHGLVILKSVSPEADGAEVFVDEKQRMTVTSQPGGEPITLDVDAGAHKLKVSKPGFAIFTRDFSIASGGREQIEVRLEPTNPSLVPDAPSAKPPSKAEPPETPPRPPAPSVTMSDIPFHGLVPSPARVAGFRRWQIETRAPRGDIFAVAWDRDGRRVACGSPIGNVRVIDVETSKTVCIIPAHTGVVWAIDWSPTQDRIVTAGEDGAVRLFDSRGKLLHELGSHPVTARSVAFNPDGTWIASGGADAKVRLWRTSGEPGPVLSGHTSQVDGVAWHPSGKKLASACLDGTVRTWDLNGSWSANGIRGVELKGHLGGVLGLSWSPDGELLASAGVDGTVLLTAGDGTQHSVLSGHGHAVTATTWSSNGLLATSGEDRTVKLWRRDGTLIATQPLEVGRINDLAWSRDGSRLAIATDNQGIRFLKQSGEWDGGIPLDTASMRAISFNRAGEFATAGDGGSVGIWNADGTRKALLKGHTKTAYSISWSPSGAQLVSGSRDKSVRVWNINGDLLETRDGTNPAAWNPATEEIAWTTGTDINIAKAGGPTLVLRGHKSQVIRLVWNSAGTQLASSDVNGEIRAWNRDGSPAGVIQADPLVLALAWHPGKPQLASGSAGSGNIHLWALDGSLIRAWNAHIKGVIALDWSSNGERLLSSAYDQRVHVWNEQGLAVGQCPGPMAMACAAAWNATGQQIATAHIDGTVCVWDGNTLAPKTMSISFNDGHWARFDSTGLSGSSDPAADADRLVVVAEDEFGVTGLVDLSKFRDRKLAPATKE